VASDTTLEGRRAAFFPGFQLTTLWTQDTDAVVPVNETDTGKPSFFPRGAGVRFIHFTVPPRDTTRLSEADAAAARAQMDDVFPGLMESMDPNMLGMHRSDTLDFLYIVSGRVVLRLQDGNAVALEAGDTVVQTGTWHRWENPSSEPCHIIAVLLAAKRVS
jgi:mannose-6-phosphate isomerase-like protein (cupin superfamily)